MIYFIYTAWFAVIGYGMYMLHQHGHFVTAFLAGVLGVFFAAASYSEGK